MFECIHKAIQCGFRRDIGSPSAFRYEGFLSSGGKLVLVPLAVAFGELSAAGELSHVDRGVIFFEDFLSDDMLNNIFHRDDSGDGSEFVDSDGKLLSVLQEGLKGVRGRGVVRDEERLVGELLDPNVLVAFCLRTKDVASADNSSNVIDLVFKNWNPRERDVLRCF